MKKIFTLMIALVSMFTTAATAANVVFNVTVPFDASKPTTHMTYQVWVVGSFNDWNNNLTQMTKVDDTHYTITMDDTTWPAGVTKENVQYKYMSGGGDWAYVEKDEAGEELKNNRVYTGTITNADGITYTGTNGNDIVTRWALTFNPNIDPIPMRVTINAFVPVEVIELYIVGTFNGWAIPTDTTKMALVETTPEGKIFTIQIFSPDLNKLSYKFAAGPSWDYEQVQGEFKYPDVTQNEATEVVPEFKKYFDPTKTGDITITATVPAGTERVWIMGSHLGWNWANLEEGTKNTDGTFKFMAKNVMSMEYRLYNWNTEWSHPEVGEVDPTKELANRVANFPADANINITVWGWKQPAPTGFPTINSDKYKVYSSNRTIVVEGVTSSVEVYEISGRIVESAIMTGVFNSKQLNKGLYIIKVDGATKKVSVN